jgi:hypothetical protein
MRLVRRIILILLIFFLPLQWTAAAVDLCCTHTPASAEQSIGQDEHEQASNASVPRDSERNTTFQSDCASCLGCCAHALASGVSLAPREMRAHNQVQCMSYIPDSVPESLFRPPVANLT